MTKFIFDYFFINERRKSGPIESELNREASIKRSQISHGGITRKNVIRVKSVATAAATEAGSLPFCTE